MKRWKKILATLTLSLGIGCYIFHESHGLKQEDKVINEYRALAVQKADVNHDKKISAEEAFAAYRSIGLSGDEIFQRMDVNHKYNIILKLWDSDKNKEKYYDAVKRTYNPARIDKYYRCEEISTSIDAFVKKLLDRNNDGKLDYEEIERAYNVAYGTEALDQKSFLLKTWEDKSMGDMLFKVFIRPDTFHEGSELERYVKAGERK